MSVKILYRPSEVVEGEWQTLATAASGRDAADELASWQRTSPGHGDLVRLVGPKSERLFVFDSARSGFVEAKAKRGQLAWVERWEGEKANAESMLRAAKKVDRRRLVLAACACAETALRFVPSGENRPRIAIEMARAWAHGEASTIDVRKARYATYSAAYASVYVYASASYASYAASYASAAVFDAAAAYAAAADAAYAAAAYDADAAYAATAEREKHLRSMAPLVRRNIPISVLMCALVGSLDPLQIPRE